jgi:tripartite-type tricarboxylate transporter receptor subunit TctC
VAKIASGYLAVVVHPSVPATTIAELVALLKDRPDKFSFSSGGFGTPAHLAAEVFMLQTGTHATHVPYPQAQQRIADLLSGATQFAFFNTPAVVAHIASGKLRALAVTAPQRVAALKDVPTVDEQGFPGLRIVDWQAFTVRGGSPDDVITRLNAAVNRALDKRLVQDALLRIGYQATGGTPAELGALIRSEAAYWRKVVVDSRIAVRR